MCRKWAESDRRARKKWRRCTYRKRRIIEGASSSCMYKFSWIEKQKMKRKGEDREDQTGFQPKS